MRFICTNFFLFRYCRKCRVRRYNFDNHLHYFLKACIPRIVPFGIILLQRDLVFVSNDHEAVVFSLLNCIFFYRVSFFFYKRVVNV